jgi:hypothetical protein
VVARTGTTRPGGACVDHAWNRDWLPVRHRRSLHTRTQPRREATRKPAWTETRACSLLYRTRPRRARRPPAHKPITQNMFPLQRTGTHLVSKEDLTAGCCCSIHKAYRVRAIFSKEKNGRDRGTADWIPQGSSEDNTIKATNLLRNTARSVRHAASDPSHVMYQQLSWSFPGGKRNSFETVLNSYHSALQWKRVTHEPMTQVLWRVLSSTASSTGPPVRRTGERVPKGKAPRPVWLCVLVATNRRDRTPCTSPFSLPSAKPLVGSGRQQLSHQSTKPAFWILILHTKRTPSLSPSPFRQSPHGKNMLDLV